MPGIAASWTTTARALVLLLTIATPTTSHAQDVSRMDAVMRSYASRNQFAGSVLVARGDHVIFSKAYGLANVEWNIPATPDTRFKVASITKQFTAAAILLLEERGRLKLADPIQTYLPEAPASWGGITLFHLLTHRAGFPGLGSPATGRQPAVESPDGTVAGFVAALMQRPLESVPGERFNYTNSGYLILGHLIQKLTGQPYEAFIRDTFLNPLGMRDTGLDSPAVIPHRGGSYTVTPDGLVNASYASDRIVPNSAAGLYSTTNDLLKWQNALYGGRVLSQASLDKMTTVGQGEYGLGIYLRTIGGRRAANHGGGAPPFANLSYFFDSRISVIVLSNLSVTPSAEIASHLAVLAHGDRVTLMSERREVALDPTVLAPYAGTYQFADGPDIAITIVDRHLVLQPTGGQAIVLIAESSGRFFHRDLNIVVDFERDGSGQVTGFTLLQAGRQQNARRVK